MWGKDWEGGRGVKKFFLFCPEVSLQAGGEGKLGGKREGEISKEKKGNYVANAFFGGMGIKGS